MYLIENKLKSVLSKYSLANVLAFPFSCETPK